MDEVNRGQEPRVRPGDTGHWRQRLAYHHDPPPITPARMLGEASKTRVIYRSHSVPPHHQANFRAFDPLDFLAEVSVYIPDAREMTTLFSGWYFHRTRGYRRRHGLLGKAERTEPVFDEPTRAPWRSAARACVELRRDGRLICHVYELCLTIPTA